jgi:signal peptidase I
MQTKLKQLAREYRGLLIFISLMMVFRSALADWMVVPSGSMNPTLMEGDYILVEKAHYGLHLPFTSLQLMSGADPQRGEIAVFWSPADGKRLVKRVIGVPGDRVALRDERLYINGVAAEYETVEIPRFEREMLERWSESEHQIERERGDGIDHYLLLQPQQAARRDFDEIDVPAGQYLMLGDNRDNSADSRYIGLVPRAAFIGRATRVVASFNPDEYLLPRFDRTFAPLR